MLELAKEYECPIRYVLSSGLCSHSEFSETTEHAAALLNEFNPRRPDMFFDNFYDETATKENLLSIINGISDGTQRDYVSSRSRG